MLCILLILAAEMALEAVNANDSVLRDYNLKLKVNNGECRAEAVMTTFIYYVLFNIYKKLVGILGEKQLQSKCGAIEWPMIITHLFSIFFLNFLLTKCIH